MDLKAIWSSGSFATAATLPRELESRVRRLYLDSLAPMTTGAFDRLKGQTRRLFDRGQHRVLFQRAYSYLSKGIDDAAEMIRSASNQVCGSEMVQYWKAFIRGLPEYSVLIKAGKFEEIENILTTLARQNAVLRIHEERIREIQQAVKELRNAQCTS